MGLSGCSPQQGLADGTALPVAPSRVGDSYWSLRPLVDTSEKTNEGGGQPASGSYVRPGYGPPDPHVNRTYRTAQS